jgi:hypothetical protein
LPQVPPLPSNPVQLQPDLAHAPKPWQIACGSGAGEFAGAVSRRSFSNIDILYLLGVSGLTLTLPGDEVGEDHRRTCAEIACAA